MTRLAVLDRLFACEEQCRHALSEGFRCRMLDRWLGFAEKATHLLALLLGLYLPWLLIHGKVAEVIVLAFGVFTLLACANRWFTSLQTRNNLRMAGIESFYEDLCEERTELLRKLKQNDTLEYLTSFGTEEEDDE